MDCFVAAAPRNDDLAGISRNVVGSRNDDHPFRLAFTAIDSARAGRSPRPVTLLAHVEGGGGELVDNRGEPRGEKLRSATSTMGLREKCSRGKPPSSNCEAGVPSRSPSADLCSHAALALGGGDNHPG